MTSNIVMGILALFVLALLLLALTLLLSIRRMK